MVLQRTAIRSAGPLGVEVACSRGRPRRSSRLLLLGSLDQLALLEGAQGAGERDQLRPVDRPPALLGGLEELRRLRRESPAPAMRGLILLGSRPRRGENTSPRRSRRRRDRSAPPATRAPGTSTTSPSGPAPTTTAPSPFPQRPRRRGRSPAPRAQPQPRSVRTPRPPRGGDAGLVAYMGALGGRIPTRTNFGTQQPEFWQGSVRSASVLVPFDGATTGRGACRWGRRWANRRARITARRQAVAGSGG
jgi:hypothetical protein